MNLSTSLFVRTMPSVEKIIERSSCFERGVTIDGMMQRLLPDPK
jgi:hypothetical protein